MFDSLKGLASKALTATLSDTDLLLNGLAPDGFRVQGDLILVGKKELKRLPEGLSVGGSLNLLNCSSLEALPTGLQVGNDLILTGCTSLKELPTGLKVKGDLVLEGHASLQELPQDLEVVGSLRLEGCTALKRLPDPLHLKGSLCLRNCTSLVELPNLWIRGNLEIQNCKGIQRLSQGQRVERDILAKGSGLRSLPANLDSCRSLDLSDCVNLTQFPRKFSGSGDVLLMGCTSLTSLPVGLTVICDLKLNGCTALEQLPTGLKVEGSLELSGCTSLKEIPKDAKIEGRVRVNDCSSLKVLRGDLNFGDIFTLSGLSELGTFDPPLIQAKRITISDAKKLSKVPTGLKAEFLTIRNCIGLEEIPEDLNVQALMIINAPRLKHIPANLASLQALCIENCPALEDLPKGLDLTTLSVRHCQQLKRVPTDIKVSGKVEFFSCPGLEALSLTVHKTARQKEWDWRWAGWADINIFDCSRLKVLVLSGLAETCDVRNCPSLITIRGALAVRNFEVVRCAQIRLLEILLTEVHELRLADCPELTAMPTSIAYLEGLEVARCLKLAQQPWRLQVAGHVIFEDMGTIPLPPGIFLKPGARLEFSGSEINPLDPRFKGVDLRWRGVPADNRFFHPETIQVKDILEERNAAIRAALFSRMGLARFLSEAKAKIIDSDLDAGGRRQLIEVPMPAGEPIVGLKVICPSTEHIHFLRIPPTIRNCEAAAAWIAGFANPEDYKPVLET